MRRIISVSVVLCITLGLVAAGLAIAADATAPAKAEKPAKAKAAPRQTAPATAEFPPPAGGLIMAPPASEEGFVPIFNGKDLTGWDGNPKLWSVKDGVLRGETTVENPTKGNTFCIWRGGTPGDFELRLTYRLHGGNSGVQYRSKDMSNWVVGGYQAEIANDGGRDGFIYEEKGKRGRMCLVGEKVVWGKDGKKVVGSVGDYEKIKSTFKKDDWNDYRIIAQGNHVVHYINGVQMIDFTDDDEANRAMSGIIAIQIHAGGPMVIEVKDLRLKKLDSGAAAPAATAPKAEEKPAAK
jgi:hypothetical protein